MSNIGTKYINIPQDTTILMEDNKLFITGLFGTELIFLERGIQIELLDQKLYVRITKKTKETKSFHGLTRTLIQNAIIGVQQKYKISLFLEGLGYKFFLDKHKIIVSVGFRKPITVIIPENIEVKSENFSNIIIIGINKEKVFNFASNIRKIRPPEPYKGKGILYFGEIIKKKIRKKSK